MEIWGGGTKFWERGDGRGWRTNNVTMPYGCGLWRKIMKEWVEVSNIISFRIEDGGELVSGDISDVGITC